MIPFLDLQVQRLRIEHKINEAIQRVLDHGRFILGPEVLELEETLACHVGSKHCITVASGTDAISASLMSLGVGPGDAVITTPFTFFATVEAIMLQGATPVFADIDPRTFNVSPSQIETAINRIKQDSNMRLRGIVTVDLFGLPCDYPAINAIAAENELFVLQDAAQAFGSSRDGKLAPSHGLVGTTSFFPAKPLGCYGDGGAIFTDDESLADQIRSIRLHGKGIDKYDNVRVGINSRLDTIQAAILLEKFRIYEEELELRQQVAHWYQDRLDTIAGTERLSHARQWIPEGSKSAWAQFVIQTDRRDLLISNLASQQIPSAVYYRIPCHLARACRELPLQINLPVAEALAHRVLALPFGPYMNKETVEQVCSVVASIQPTATLSN